MPVVYEFTAAEIEAAFDLARWNVRVLWKDAVLVE